MERIDAEGWEGEGERRGELAGQGRTRGLEEGKGGSRKEEGRQKRRRKRRKTVRKKGGGGGGSIQAAKTRDGQET